MEVKEIPMHLALACVMERKTRQSIGCMGKGGVVGIGRHVPVITPCPFVTHTYLSVPVITPLRCRVPIGSPRDFFSLPWTGRLRVHVNDQLPSGLAGSAPRIWAARRRGYRHVDARQPFTYSNKSDDVSVLCGVDVRRTWGKFRAYLASLSAAIRWDRCSCNPRCSACVAYLSLNEGG